MTLRKILPLIAATALIIPACKTTEKNYRTAYERTMAAQDSTRTRFDQTIYGKYRREVRTTKAVIAGDTVDIRTQRVYITPGDSVPKGLKSYCVIVGQFKQLFNAQSMRQRLRDKGYTDAHILQTAEPYYYVAATAYDDHTQAAASLKRIQAAPPFRLRAPLPFILHPAR